MQGLCLCMCVKGLWQRSLCFNMNICESNVWNPGQLKASLTVWLFRRPKHNQYSLLFTCRLTSLTQTRTTCREQQMLTQEKQTVTQFLCLHIVRDTNHPENSCSEESRCSQTPSKLLLNDSLKKPFLPRTFCLSWRLVRVSF